MEKIISLEEYRFSQERIDNQYILALEEEAENLLAIARILRAQAMMRAQDRLIYSQIGDPRNEQQINH